MIAKRSRGSDVGGLLRYLFGPGRANEHSDPHLVAAWDQEWLPGGAFAELPRSRLARALDAHRLVHEIPADKHVYHVVISLPEGDGRPGDAIWREVVEDGVAWMGLAECRWVAVHHGPSAAGNDHVHLVVVDVEPGGHRPDLYRDWNRWRHWCTTVEARMGWTPTAPVRAGRSGASRAEVERDRRAGQRSGAGRTALERAVHASAAAAADEREFFDQLAAHRVAVRLRADPATGHIRGYAVARTSRTGRPCGPWISGSRLRRDLSLPRLRARWAHTPAAPSGRDGLEVLLQRCEGELREWLRAHPGPDPAAWGAAASEVADLAVTVARWRPELTPAALELAGAAQPARARDRAGAEVMLPLLRLTVRTLATGRPAPVLLVAAVLALAAVAVLLDEAVRFYRAHAAARRRTRRARRAITAIAAGVDRRAGQDADRPARRAAAVRTAARALTPPTTPPSSTAPASHATPGRPPRPPAPNRRREPSQRQHLLHRDAHRFRSDETAPRT